MAPFFTKDKALTVDGAPVVRQNKRRPFAPITYQLQPLKLVKEPDLDDDEAPLRVYVLLI